VTLLILVLVLWITVSIGLGPLIGRWLRRLDALSTGQ
jgi:hypothetical protein